MRKVLFIGVDNLYLKALLDMLSPNKQSLIESFSAMCLDDVIQIATENPDISIVFFMGYILTLEDGGSFEANICVATSLKKILKFETIFFAATGEDDTDKKLKEIGCNVIRPFERVNEKIRDILQDGLY